MQVLIDYCSHGTASPPCFSLPLSHIHRPRQSSELKVELISSCFHISSWNILRLVLYSIQDVKSLTRWLTSSVLHFQSEMRTKSLTGSFSSSLNSVSFIKLESRWLSASNLVSSTKLQILSNRREISTQDPFLCVSRSC